MLCMSVTDTKSPCLSLKFAKTKRAWAFSVIWAPLGPHGPQAPPFPGLAFQVAQQPQADVPCVASATSALPENGQIRKNFL